MKVMKRYIILGILFTVIGVLNAQDKIASLRNNLLHDDTQSLIVQTGVMLQKIHCKLLRIA